MLLRLHDDYCLRGWKGAACGLVNRRTGQTVFVEPPRFSLLLLCDGVTELDESVLSDDEKSWIKKAAENSIIEQADSPRPLNTIQEYVKYDNRYIKSVLWSVTGRCNFKCRHCYMDAPNGLMGEVSHEEALGFIDGMADCGITEVMLTGGETFVRPDIWSLIGHLTERGIIIRQIYSNGWLVDDSVLDRLEAAGQKPEFSISFDGLGWHDWMRGVPGAETRVLDAIGLCRSRGYKTAVEMCMHRGSAGSLRETVRRMGALDTRIKVGSVMNTELWQKNSEGLGMTDEEYFETTLSYIDAFFEDGMPADLTLGSVVSLHKGSCQYEILAEKHDGSESCRDHFLCGAAKMNAYITPDGRLLPCMPMTSWDGYVRFPRIQETGMKQALTDGFYTEIIRAKIDDLIKRNNECGKCEYILRCGGGCRACALSESGDLFGRDSTQCFFWKNGYVDRIRTVTEAAIAKYANKN